ncbi:hypothetical protein NDU88_007857 [Pleurodeles waltl]|uniref:Uncharacterized protein n=1 Tax=Pleurodeles waltl TaxID=8319 RepID=A0AAV7N398_PLEWA|nr:hypothetical protein NDU88_007857 [Pleurodeles waltl]
MVCVPESKEKEKTPADRGESRSDEERRRTAVRATGERRREPDGKCPVCIRNSDSGAGGAPRSFQPRFRRSEAHTRK